MSYYDELIQEIQEAIHTGDRDEAAYLIRRELSMPYVPVETEQKLQELKKELRYIKSEQYESGEPGTDALLRRLKGKPQSQIRAAAALCDRNLRQITDELRDWLAKDPQPEAASLVIDALGEQEIAEEFMVVRDGIEYTFSGDAVVPVVKSSGFRRGLGLIERWLAKDPSLVEMARSLLVQKCYTALPLSYEFEEGPLLAKECVEAVLTSMGLESRIPEIDAKYKEECEKLYS